MVLILYLVVSFNDSPLGPCLVMLMPAIFMTRRHDYYGILAEMLHVGWVTIATPETALGVYLWFILLHCLEGGF